MLRRFTKKRVVVALGAVVALALAAGAYAYFTTTGSATATATVGAPTSWKVTTGTVTGPSLVPDPSIGVTANSDGSPSLTFATGAQVQTIPYTVKNQDSGSEYLAKVTVAIDSTSLPSGCSTSDFSVDGAAVGTTATDTSLHGTFTAGTSQSGDATIEMIDSGSSQNACKNAQPILDFNAS